MTRILNEGLNYHDMEGMVEPVVSVDEYKASIGSDDEIVTVAFITKGKQCGDDLVDWLERGYDWVLDSERSEGELTDGKYLVFVEMNRRYAVPDRIVEMVEDMETLTALPASQWRVKIDGETYPLRANAFRSHLALSPHEYREQESEELNEARSLAGLEHEAVSEVKTYDPELQAMRNIAGL